MRRIPLLPLLSILLVLPAPSAAGATGYAVVGGQPAPDGAHPSVVALVRAEVDDDVTGQLCGGTAIAEDLVLTAAHCFHDADAVVWRPPDQVRVIAGRTDLSGQGGVEVAGAEVWLHPAYDARRRRFDVAVLRVAGPLGVPPQALVDADVAGPFEGDRATVVGWGRTGPDDGQSSASTRQLHEASVTISADDVCRSAFEGSLDLLAHLCAGGDGTESAPAPDACRGDSGGPLLLADPASGTPVQHGVTSFGPTSCGVGEPGVYARLSTARDFVDDVVAGRLPASVLPDAPAPGRLDPVRVAGEHPTTAIGQAIAASQAVFGDGLAELAVLARDDGFADALAGSTLGYGRGPLLYTASTGGLDHRTRAELQRAVPLGGTVYLLGGDAAVPVAVEQQLSAMGYATVRLAGPTREATAAAIAREVVRRHGDGDRPPYGTAVLATAQAWPDAVVAGQLGAWWGYPILLTPADQLHPETRQALRDMALDRLIVVGGPGAVAASVEAMVGDLLPGVDVLRLAGSDRTGTAIEVARWHQGELARRGEPPPDAVVVANLRAEGASSHLLSATPIMGATAGVLLPVEGEAGDVLTAGVVDATCGAGGVPIVVGGVDVVTEAVAQHAADVLAGIGCTPAER
jgi:secreted trypsin-like serine protease